MKEEMITITNKELLIDLNTKLMSLIRKNDFQGRPIVSLVNLYPDGYKLPKLLCQEVTKYIQDHHHYLLEYGDICDPDRTEVSVLKKLL